MGKDKSKYEIIDTEAKDVLSTAVSDVGYWQWWDYWKDYYDKRDTEEAYEKDYACEVTIPLKK